MTSTTDSASTQRWDEIDAILEEHKKTLQAAETHLELREFAKDHGFDNENDFGKYKYCLRKIGVDYAELRAVAMQQRNAELTDKANELAQKAAGQPVIRLWCAAVEDANTGQGSYAIIDCDGAVLWYGKFFDDDPRSIRQAGDLTSAEQDVADKCVYLAGKAREVAGEDIATVWINTTCPDLDESALRIAGARHNVAVEVIVDDEDHAAVDMANMPGFKRVRDNSEQTLIDLLEYEVETTEGEE